MRRPSLFSAAAAAILYLGVLGAAPILLAAGEAQASSKKKISKPAKRGETREETKEERAERFARWRQRQAEAKHAKPNTERPKSAERTRAIAAPATAPSSASASAAPPSRGPTRIDFDDRLIQGQTNRSGAVYLYDRKELKNRSMLKPRDSFREEIVGAVYDN